MIVICGCSWALAAWNDSGSLNGPGLAQYFGFWEPVTNLARPGSGNFEQASKLRQFLSQYRATDQDRCYWVVTELSRDFGLVLDRSPRAMYDHALNDFLQQANDLAQHISIELIGGLCDLNHVDITAYPNLKIAVPSWCQLFDPEFPVNIYSEISYQLAAQACTDQQKHEVAWITDQSNQKRRAYQTLANFRASHPDQTAHLHLRNILHPEWSGII